MEEMIILVDDFDNEIGAVEKLEAHVKGMLHRAFSIFIFNSKGELMLQKRACHKYHSGGLWTNTCCSHPNMGETMEEAIHKRLIYEMGFDCKLQKLKSFLYRAQLDNNLEEHELDHIFFGIYDGEPSINKDEVEQWKWIDLEKLRKEMEDKPENYTYWFKFAMNQIISKEELEIF